MGDLLDGYAPNGTWDEMYSGAGSPRVHCTDLHEALSVLSRADFEARCTARDRSFREQGITFAHAGEERPFPLDLVPRVIGSDEWGAVEAGVGQRVRALEAFLADVYGPGEILADGIVPRRLVATSTHFHRAVAGLEPPGIPARYASGYLFPLDEAEIGASVEGQSHAWLEAWVGDWCPMDPTTAMRVAERHVLVARGRDYADVPPLKGVYNGSPARSLEVPVGLTRVA